MEVATLSALAADALVAALVTEAREDVRQKVARWFGRGEPDSGIERRMDATWQRLTREARADISQLQEAEAAAWRTRFADLLADYPDTADDLRALIGEIAGDSIAALSHSAAAGRDMAPMADHGSVAANIVHGDVAVGPYLAGHGGRLAGSGAAVLGGPGSIVGALGGTAIGTYHAAPREQAARLPVSLSPRPDSLAGREDLLVRLDRMLADGEPPRKVVLCGMSGVGKTSLAVEYAHRHLAEVGVAWQVRAEDPEVAAADLAELAAQLGGREIADPRNPVASAHAVLASHSAPWLIVFDNAPDQTSVRDLLPPAGNGCVIVTSQSQHWPFAQMLDVPMLDVVTATQFLVNRANDPDQLSAFKLAGELGGLPLALEQAAAYVRAAGITLSTYLDLFGQRQAELLARGDAVGHPDSVRTTVALALARLEDRWAIAVGLLRLLTCLAPETIPLDLLLTRSSAGKTEGTATAIVTALTGDPIAVADAISALRRCSLVSTAGAGMVLVHRLVRVIVADQTPADQVTIWRHAAASLVEHAIPADVSDLAVWPVCAMLLPHAQASLELTSDGIQRIAQYLGDSGNYPAARDLLQQIAEALNTADGYGPEHPKTLAACVALANWTGLAGDMAGARDLLSVLVPTLDQLVGAEHPETLAARGSLADWTGLAGDAAAARDMFAEVVLARETVSGPEHPDTLTAQANLASFTGRAGDAAAARDQYAELIPARKRNSGAEHPDTLTALANQARWTGMAGDAAAARDLLTALVPIRERVSGPEHPLTLIDRANLAYWTGQTGDALSARNLLTALIPVWEKVAGFEHPDTLNSRAHLARFTGEAGDAAAARDMFAELAPIRQKILGTEHPYTLTDRANLEHFDGKAGDAETARDMFAELVPDCEKVLGPEHPDTLTARTNLAFWSGRSGMAIKATSLWR